MNEYQIERFKKLLQELLTEGYGKVVWEVVVKNGKIEYTSLTKSSTYQVDPNLKKG